MADELMCPGCGALGQASRFRDMTLYVCESTKEPGEPFFQSPDCRIAELTEPLKGLVVTLDWREADDGTRACQCLPEATPVLCYYCKAKAVLEGDAK